jgi:hypothetical protein
MEAIRTISCRSVAFDSPRCPFLAEGAPLRPWVPLRALAALEELAVRAGTPLIIKLDTDNPHDPHAVIVLTQSLEVVGWLARYVQSSARHRD